MASGGLVLSVTASCAAAGCPVVWLVCLFIMAHMFGILEYGAAIWCCAIPPAALMDKVEALWKKACRAALGARSFTHSAAVLGDLELWPLHIRRAVVTATLYHKVAGAPNGSIVAEVFRARRTQFLGGGAHLPLHHTWLQQVDDALRLLGLSDHFLQLEDAGPGAAGLISRAMWRSKVRRGAREAMVAWWRSEVERHSPHMELLRRLCPDGPARQRYIESRAGRLKGFLAELRAGSLPLRLGAPICRYARFDAKAADDLCRLCGSEDESLLHFLFRCPALELLRRAADPFWARITPDIEGVAKVLSGFSGSPHGFERLTGCWFRMWRFREDCLRLTDDVSFALRWPGLRRARTLPAIVPVVAVPLPVAGV